MTANKKAGSVSNLHYNSSVKMLDIVLTSLVNNDYLLNRVIDDINDRFKMNVDKDKLVKYLSTYECNQDIPTSHIW